MLFIGLIYDTMDLGKTPKCIQISPESVLRLQVAREAKWSGFLAISSVKHVASVSALLKDGSNIYFQYFTSVRASSAT